MNGVKCSLIIYLLRVFMKGGYKMISLMKIVWKFERKKEFNPLFFLMRNVLNQGKLILLFHNILLLQFFGQ